MSFKKIDASSEDFTTLQEIAAKAQADQRGPGLDYNELVDVYNDLEVKNGFIVLGVSAKSAQAVRKKLETHGLDYHDYLVFAVEDDGKQTLAIKRLSSSLMRHVAPQPRKPRTPKAD